MLLFNCHSHCKALVAYLGVAPILAADRAGASTDTCGRGGGEKLRTFGGAHSRPRLFELGGASERLEARLLCIERRKEILKIIARRVRSCKIWVQINHSKEKLDAVEMQDFKLFFSILASVCSQIASTLGRRIHTNLVLSDRVFNLIDALCLAPILRKIRLAFGEPFFEHTGGV